MENINLGGQAFPIPESEGCHRTYGMTLRDYFAGQALISICHQENPMDPLELDRISIGCYELANSMLKARNK